MLKYFDFKSVVKIISRQKKQSHVDLQKLSLVENLFDNCRYIGANNYIYIII